METRMYGPQGALADGSWKASQPPRRPFQFCNGYPQIQLRVPDDCAFMRIRIDLIGDPCHWTLVQLETFSEEAAALYRTRLQLDIRVPDRVHYPCGGTLPAVVTERHCPEQLSQIALMHRAYS
jgi:hypothetical protein